MSLKTRRRRHVSNRCMERYGFDLSAKDIKEIVKIIQKGNDDICMPVSKTSNTRTIFNVKYNDVELRVVYNKKAKKVIEFCRTKEQVDGTENCT